MALAPKFTVLSTAAGTALIVSTVTSLTLYWKCVRKGGFLTGNLEDRVIPDTMDDLGGPQGSYPEGFVSLSLFLAEIYKFVVLVKKRDRQT